MRFITRAIGIMGPVVLVTCAFGDNGNSSFLAQLSNLSTVGSTVPSNGDVNPYGTAVVPQSKGALVEGDVLVSNFNNSANNQGAGTTIVEIGSDGKPMVFAQLNTASLPGTCPGGVGLTTALVVLRSGWVIVGSLPTSDGTAATAQAGCLIVLNQNGQPVMTLAGNGINGPWDMTALDFDDVAILFVTNVLNGTVAADGQTVNGATVLRIVLATPSQDGTMPQELGRTPIASGLGEHSDPDALIVGPTGLGFAPNGTLYIADTVASRIAAVPNALFRMDSAGVGTTVSQGGALNGPLGLTIAPNGDILTVNASDGNIVETTPSGTQVATKAIDVSLQGAGTLFGLAITHDGKGVYFVDDGNNTLNVLR
jgi:hypothetical protein